MARKLNSFIQLHGDKEVLIEKFLEFYKKQLRREISHMEMDLKNFEKKYGMSNDEFATKFSEGKLDDSNDFQIWSGILEMQNESKNKLKHICS